MTWSHDIRIITNIQDDASTCMCSELVRRRGSSARGHPTNLVSNYNLSETVKVSIVTSLALNSPPIHVNMRRGDRANDQFDFLLFVWQTVFNRVYWCKEIHWCRITHPFTRVSKYCNPSMHSWLLLALPCGSSAYSPELNPCEFVFAQSKKYLRYHRRMEHPFWYR